MGGCLSQKRAKDAELDHARASRRASIVALQPAAPAPPPPPVPRRKEGKGKAVAEAAQDTVRHSPVWYAVVEGAIADAPTLKEPKTQKKKKKHRKHHHRRATAKPKGGAHHRRRKTNVSGEMPSTMKKRGKRKRQTIARSRTRRQSTERLVSMMQVAKLREKAGLGGVGGAGQTSNAKLKRVTTFRVAEPLAHSKSPAQMLQMTAAAAAAAAAPGGGGARAAARNEDERAR